MAADEPGPTGKFPYGKARPDDQGELAVAISVKDGNVFLDFGKAVSWLSLKPHQAEGIAAAIVHYAKEAMEQR
jgi:hypothetical protein